MHYFKSPSMDHFLRGKNVLTIPNFYSLFTDLSHLQDDFIYLVTLCLKYVSATHRKTIDHIQSKLVHTS